MVATEAILAMAFDVIGEAGVDQEHHVLIECNCLGVGGELVEEEGLQHLVVPLESQVGNQLV